jgi:tRNA (guanine-N7-)-methyltransferase
VRRTRRLPVAELEPYLLEVGSAGTPERERARAQAPAPLDWRLVFGNDHPVEVEVGFGKGLFLLSAGQARPETNFLGIEIERKYQLFTANRLAKRGLKNVRLACTDARTFFRDHLAGASVQAIHVYFPDPWWKKRHQKRRVFTEEFAAQCARILRPGGRLHILTDVADYFTFIQKLLAGQTTLASMPADEKSDSSPDLECLTNFERKYRQEGRPIYQANHVRRQDGNNF